MYVKRDAANIDDKENSATTVTAIVPLLKIKPVAKGMPAMSKGHQYIRLEKKPCPSCNLGHSDSPSKPIIYSCICGFYGCKECMLEHEQDVRSGDIAPVFEVIAGEKAKIAGKPTLSFPPERIGWLEEVVATALREFGRQKEETKRYVLSKD